MKPKYLLLSSTVLLTACQSTSQTSTSNEMIEQVYVIEQQSAQRLAESSLQLAQKFESYCVKQADKREVEEQWQQTMHSWMALQGQERGPEAALALNWNIQFWPDKKNTTGRKMSQLLQQNQNWNSELIQQQSVTTQGLGAVEWLLFDKSSTLPKPEACQLGNAITRNLALNTQKIEQAWQVNPWSEFDQTMWLNEYIALLANQLDYSMKKLSRPLAKIGQPRPYFAESWRSEKSLTWLKYNVEAMRTLYIANGVGLDNYLRKQGHAELADRINDHFDSTLASWPASSSLFAALQTKSGYQDTLSLYNKLEYLKYLIHEEVAIELNIVIGFNATDGD
ncbi:imelysin family protein [Aliivibrio fischeri]|uniref:Imelysin superfamily protein n=1 Tax=Aliivibrio fischeri (strain MJ11) TaxID=388396 RepID=B5FDS6_ALIFM|nr:imelysin family protein [Aliivibrio fischeri]ACH67176.1 imelysin superfamily protein [Aliivibrio fischeri MJ11]MCE4934321.1 imelysin family protein [Aliivibrio fischeri]OED57454.1 iron-regulated protein A [Aliivibrio fischeri]